MAKSSTERPGSAPTALAVHAKRRERTKQSRVTLNPPVKKCSECGKDFCFDRQEAMSRGVGAATWPEVWQKTAACPGLCTLRYEKKQRIVERAALRAENNRKKEERKKLLKQEVTTKCFYCEEQAEIVMQKREDKLKANPILAKQERLKGKEFIGFPVQSASVMKVAQTKHPEKSDFQQICPSCFVNYTAMSVKRYPTGGYALNPMHIQGPWSKQDVKNQSLIAISGGRSTWSNGC